MWQADKGIILSAIRHNDKSCVVRVFTRSNGMTPFIYYLSTSSKGASRNTLVQPMTRISFQSEGAPSSNLKHMRDVRNTAPYRNILFNPAKSAISIMLGEFLSYALAGEETNPLLFEFMENSMEWLDMADEGDYSNFHLRFLLEVARYLGICPNPEGYRPGFMLDMREGVFAQTASMPGETLDQDYSYKVVMLLQSDYDNMQSAPLTGQQRTSLLRFLNDWFRLHIPSFPKIKSIDILEEVFD